MRNYYAAITRSAILFFTTAIALGQAASPDAPIEKLSKQELTTRVGDINGQLVGTDSAQLDLAVHGIKDLLNHGEMPSPLLVSWLPALTAKSRHADVAELALGTLVASPDANNALRLMDMRARAFLALNQPAQALAAAKIAYNLCLVGDTEKAINLIGEVLAKAGPDDPAAARKFRLEQADGSAASKNNGTAQPAQPFLKTIQIDQTPFIKALEFWKTKNVKFGDTIKYANLLLIADRGADAEIIFRTLYDTQPAAKDRAIAAEGVARALRAQDGTLARANAFLVSIQTVTGAK